MLVSKIRSRPKNFRSFEENAQAEGFQNIAGVDEVGRGCLAGPVLAACVILPWQETFSGVNDSKQLNEEQREKFYDILMKRAIAVGVGLVEPEEIDRMNILRASLKAMRIAIEGLHLKPDFVLVDGNQPIPLMSIQQLTIIKGDSLSLSIAAASIVAKVTRDRLMKGMDLQFPKFSFGQHKGYGTKKHWEELEAFGPTPIHRRSFIKNRFTDFAFS